MGAPCLAEPQTLLAVPGQAARAVWRKEELLGSGQTAYQRAIPYRDRTRAGRRLGGFEFGRHKLIERKLGCKVYFTDTNSPQQRGSNENLNGLIRNYFPKGKSLRHVTQMQAAEVAARLNGRPRKRYGYEAPRRLFAQATGKSPYFLR